MKRSISMFVFACVILAAAFAFAAEKSISGCVRMKSDVVRSKGDERVEYRLETLWKYGNVGMGFDSTYVPERGYGQLKPYGAIMSGPFTFVAGYDTNNKDLDYVFGGVWYAKKYGKLNLFLDVRNYFAASSKAVSYQDNFIEASYAVSGKITLGMDAVYDHFWGDKADFLLVGPVIYAKVTQRTTAFARYSREWGMSPGPNDSSDRLRLGVAFNF